MEALATRRKLRPVFLEKKPRPDRHEWMRSALASVRNEDVATEVLQTWLLGEYRPMICGFLDALDIEHSEGLMDEIPSQPGPLALEEAVDELFDANDPLVVRIYLQFFQPVDDEAWPDLDRILAEDERFAPAPDAPNPQSAENDQ